MTGVRLIASRRYLLLAFAALLLPLPAEAQSNAPANFDGVWRGTFTRYNPATYELDISQSATGKPVVRQTRWNGTEASGAGTSQTFTGTIEDNVLRYRLLQPVMADVALVLKNSDLIGGNFTMSTNVVAGVTMSLDLTRYK
jgi:hypothetical protein